MDIIDVMNFFECDSKKAAEIIKVLYEKGLIEVDEEGGV